MDVSCTRLGLRLSQHGVVLSELRTTPGPTHSVFDVLAALAVVLAPADRFGLLGFAGGGMMAPLRFLGVPGRVETVDLDATGHRLFRRHCRAWAGGVAWERGDAVDWLRSRRGRFDLLVEDLSIPQDGDVVKPEVSWRVLPALIRDRLQPGGCAVFNLLRPVDESWAAGLRRVGEGFRETRVIHLDEFENRILVGGEALPAARELGAALRDALRRLRSRQAGRIRVRRGPGGQPLTARSRGRPPRPGSRAG